MLDQYYIGDLADQGEEPSPAGEAGGMGAKKDDVKGFTMEEASARTRSAPAPGTRAPVLGYVVGLAVLLAALAAFLGPLALRSAPGAASPAAASEL